jgi:hypothetical protein
MNLIERRNYNRTLKCIFEDLSKDIWLYYRNMPKEERSVFKSKFLDNPTVSTTKVWLAFWKNKIDISDINFEYFEFIILKNKSEVI